MSKEHAIQEVEKIFHDENLVYPLNLAMAATWIMGNFKGENLKILDVNRKSSLADYFVIASASNLTQAHAMAQEIIVLTKKNGFKVVSSEGMNNADWILIDLGDVLVHIFVETARGLYNLDEIYINSPHVKIPENYYIPDSDGRGFGSEEINEKDYF